MSLLALQDLFRRYREKATGVWTLGKDPGRTIYIDYGDTVFAQSTHAQDRLTYILVERGKLTQAQMDYALGNLKPGLSIGKNLIEMGFITQRDLLEVAKAQVERIVRGGLTAPDQAPVFEARELDANVVRLPMNTAQLFLAGTLSLQDREGLLELLGPLNQVVVLQGRSLQDLTLPADLAKLPPLLDGTHTLLELSRESMAEPLRLGAFALFLREMGWARLHEMPPLDRHALDLALSPESEPLSPPLAEPFPETVPSLFSTIQEAARPTTNLEHLSQSLDADPSPRETVLASSGPVEPLQLPDRFEIPDPLPESAGAGDWPEDPFPVQPEPGYPPTPAMPIQQVPEDVADSPVQLRVPLEDPEGTDLGVAGAPPLDLSHPAPKAAPGKGLRRTLVVILLLVCCGAGGYLWATRFRKKGGLPSAADSRPPAVPAPVPAQPAPPVQAVTLPGVAVPPPAPAPRVPPVPAATATPAPAVAVAAVTPVVHAAPVAAAAAVPIPAAKASGPVPTSLSARLGALEQGDLDLAVRQGRRLVREIPPGHCTLRLEIACQGDTIRRVVELFKGRQPDLFLLPMPMRYGRGCYQVLFGRFPTPQAAERALKRLPASFLADRNRPKVFRFSELQK